ncbi:hypothetical protein FA13DRAFT_599436 [Coprinellus micaceus]|uniref:Uncharacterized protein n=1 Tax=Coprinellus micaceus TaxID=71717 RepID=A0A4Y7T6R6_COPMI|nr:hypothetical protein FA13DRAFT_599436 [Coprinellus micaceus]
MGTAALASWALVGTFLSPPRVARKAPPKARPKVPRARNSFLTVRPRIWLYRARRVQMFGNVENDEEDFFVTLRTRKFPRDGTLTPPRPSLGTSRDQFGRFLSPSTISSSSN